MSSVGGGALAGQRMGRACNCACPLPYLFFSREVRVVSALAPTCSFLDELHVIHSRAPRSHSAHSRLCSSAPSAAVSTQDARGIVCGNHHRCPCSSFVASRRHFPC